MRFDTDSPRTLHAAVVLVTGLALVVLALAVPPQGHGFGTTTLLGQQREHERLTRWALTCPAPPAGKPARGNPSCLEPLTLDEVAGKGGTFGAVGAPDVPPTGGISGGEEFVAAAHCDGGDYMPPKDLPKGTTYPRDRIEGLKPLFECRQHFKMRFEEGVRSAGGIVDEPSSGVFVINPKQVELVGTITGSSGCPFRDSGAGSAKCLALEGFGRALHGVQDFYSHTNWVDAHDPTRKLSTFNPRGLRQKARAPLMNMRRFQVPRVPGSLASGCFELKEKVSDAPSSCKGRIRHKDLDKDEGLIEPVARTTGEPETARGKVVVGGQTNFDRAVRAAVGDTVNLWADFRKEITARYPKGKAALIICALTRDDPVKQCQGRKLAIVVDSSGSNTQTDPGNVRITAAKNFNARLVSAAVALQRGSVPDLSAVIDFDDSARVISSLDDPPRAFFDSIDSSGGTNIASGVAAGIGELTKDGSDETAGRSGIVVLTDGQDSDTSRLLAELNRATSLGIRVNFGFLKPPSNPVITSVRGRARAAQDTSPPPDLVEAILATGGVYSAIDSAEAQQQFVEQVETQGATDLNDPNGEEPGGRLSPGAGASGRIAGAADRHIWSLAVPAGRRVAIRVKSLGGPMTVGARDIRTGRALVGQNVPAGAEATITGATFEASDFDIAIRGVGGGTGPYEIAAFVAGVDLKGGSGANSLSCTDAITFVQAGAGNDTVRCGAGADLIIGGPGADRLSGGPGDDIFSIGARDISRGTETIDGGLGSDTVVFEGIRRKPRRVACRLGRRIVVPAGRRGRVVLTNVEHLRFGSHPCRLR